MRLVALLATLAAAPALAPLSAQDGFGPPPRPAPEASRPATPPPPPRAAPAPAPPAPGGSTELDRLAAEERKDFGVAPRTSLHTGPMHGPTPASIPGGQVITTKGLVALLADPSLGALVFDILGGPEAIPGSQPAVPAAQPGSFNDQTQQEFGNYLRQVTGGRQDRPLVFYCLSMQCWMSYNASLRAINMGHQNVLWYRGGIEAWKAAGQRVERR